MDRKLTRTRRLPDQHQLTFEPRAWLKFQYLCHAGSTEVACFGLSSVDDPLCIEDVLILRQRATMASVAFDDNAIADLFDQMTDKGIPPRRFFRIWLHTHPGVSVDPSPVDEETFDRVFGSCDWAVMGILGRTGRTYARLKFQAGPGGSMEIPTSVDWSDWPVMAAQIADEIANWEQEYQNLVEPVVWERPSFTPQHSSFGLIAQLLDHPKLGELHVLDQP